MFQRYFDDGLAQASFLLACERTRDAVVIDPRRDVEVYVAAAKAHGLTLAYAIETHVHADFVSGAHELSALGARVVAGPGSGLGFEHHDAREGEQIQVGDIALELRHTPGHTPEHISIVARQPGEPARVFTGDTLFVGAVGRPDLLGESQTHELAAHLYDSLHQKLLTLDDAVEVHPGHGAGSLCGAGIGDEPHSTIGQERRFNPMLQHRSRDAFAAAVLADLPETPPYFARMKRLNQQGPPLLGLGREYLGVERLTPERAGAAVRRGAVPIDLRGAESFCASHVRSALNIAFGSKVGFWAGWVVPGGAPVVLLGGEREATEASRQLLRVGLDEIVGFLEGGEDAWRNAELDIAQICQITVRDLRDRVGRRDDLTLLDVRTSHEWQSGHIASATHVPVGSIVAHSAAISREAPVATICEGGVRSSLAASLLARAGLRNVLNVAGGMAAYRREESTS